MKWYVLATDGIVYALGDCGDEAAAYEVAEDVIPTGYCDVWVLDEVSARDWYAKVGEFLNKE